MTQEVMISLLNRASNGNDILAILDSLVENETDSDTVEVLTYGGQPTSL
jgi:hypothetical protein|tara:strand:- start:586 stop:732 length:147 start_codon:yes stop_codon:yes gene_type:complete